MEVLMHLGAFLVSFFFFLLLFKAISTRRFLQEEPLADPCPEIAGTFQSLLVNDARTDTRAAKKVHFPATDVTR